MQNQNSKLVNCNPPHSIDVKFSWIEMSMLYHWQCYTNTACYQLWIACLRLSSYANLMTVLFFLLTSIFSQRTLIEYHSYSCDCNILLIYSIALLIFSLLNGTKWALQMPWGQQQCSFWLLGWMVMLIKQSGWKIYSGKFGHHQMYNFTSYDVLADGINRTYSRWRESSVCFVISLMNSWTFSVFFPCKAPSSLKAKFIIFKTICYCLEFRILSSITVVVYIFLKYGIYWAFMWLMHRKL